MNLLSPIYGGITSVRNIAYERGWRRTHRLSAPVISVGNLSAGGTGKTPFVILLGELLKRRGIHFDVLSRGYGRRTRGTLLVDPAGSSAQFGDEPLLIARRLNVPVVVGEDRFGAGQFAEAKHGVQLHLLDDGFQHRRLVRDFDIVMLGPEDGRDQLLPKGRLREPLSALQRSNAIVAEHGTAVPGDAQGKPIWRISRGIKVPDAAARPVVFCGIARPQRFFDQLRAHGLDPAMTQTYRDHHAYTRNDVRRLLVLKERCGADGFVTTEKDEINLGALKDSLEPLVVASVTMDLMNADRVVDSMLETIANRRRSS